MDERAEQLASLATMYQSIAMHSAFRARNALERGNYPLAYTRQWDAKEDYAAARELLFKLIEEGI